MDMFNKFTGGGGQQQQGGEQTQQQQQQQQQSGGGGFLSGIGDKLNTAAGGGKESEKNEDYLDKAYDGFQEHVLGKGKQDNESALEQRQDEMATDFIRGQYKSMTGSDVPIKDKDPRAG